MHFCHTSYLEIDIFDFYVIILIIMFRQFLYVATI